MYGIKKVLVCAVMSLCFAGLFAQNSKIEGIDQAMSALIADQMEMATYEGENGSVQWPWYRKWSAAGEGYKGQWNYIEGVFLNSVIQLSQEKNDDSLMDFVRNYVDLYLDKDGDFLEHAIASPAIYYNGFKKGELDTVCESRILFDLLEKYGDKKYEGAIEVTYKNLLELPRAYGKDGNAGVNFSHKKGYKYQVWLDGFYMYVPFYARYAGLRNRPEIYDEIVAQYEYVHENMWNKKAGLHYHGHDTSVNKKGAPVMHWADKKTGNSRSFWLRGNGWFIVGLVDAIEYFPEGDNREYLKGLLKECLEGITPYAEKETGMYYQLVDKGEKEYKVPVKMIEEVNIKNPRTDIAQTSGKVKIKNYLETSGSAMIAYACMKASRLGYVDQQFMEKGRKTFESIYLNRFNPETKTLSGIVIQGGLNKGAKDGSPEYYMAEKVGDNEPKGVGPFIMAYIEYAR